MLAAQSLKPFFAILRGFDLGGRRRQIDAREFAMDRIVVDDEDPHVLHENVCIGAVLGGVVDHVWFLDRQARRYSQIKA